MEALILIGGFLYVCVIGFWAVGKLDQFLDNGGFCPYWDEQEEREVMECRKVRPK